MIDGTVGDESDGGGGDPFPEDDNIGELPLGDNLGRGREGRKGGGGLEDGKREGGKVEEYEPASFPSCRHTKKNHLEHRFCKPKWCRTNA